ncbi:MAG: sigma-70 family RNA polymerase sigma factor, partial [Proteobacteria bacterium]
MKGYFKEWESAMRDHRPYLLSYAFRMTGNLHEAEDMVQDTFLSCDETDPATVSNPKAWLIRVCSRKSLDHLKSAYKKRTSYPGTWLPDAIPQTHSLWSEAELDLEKNLLAKESLSTSFLLLAEKLAPEERAVYLLAEIFDHNFATIAEYLGKTESTCRKIAERARKAIAEGKPRFKSSSVRDQDLIKTFFQYAMQDDKNGLRSMLSASSEFWADGGGKVGA